MYETVMPVSQIKVKKKREKNGTVFKHTTTSQLLFYFKYLKYIKQHKKENNIHQ